MAESDSSLNQRQKLSTASDKLVSPLTSDMAPYTPMMDQQFNSGNSATQNVSNLMDMPPGAGHPGNTGPLTPAQQQEHNERMLAYLDKTLKQQESMLRLQEQINGQNINIQ